jgi:hypothetical protein
MRLQMNAGHIERAVRNGESWIERFARVGFFAIGIVYLIAGALTAMAALSDRTGTADRRDVLAFIMEKPFGSIALVLMAVGLAGYAFWRITSGIVDSDRRGTEPMGLAKRAAAIISGIVYAGLMIQIVRLIMRGSTGSGSDEAEAAQSTSRVMELPFGRVLVGLTGITLLAVGLYQLSLAWKAKLSRRLDLSRMSSSARPTVVAIARFGIAARGIVFAIVGVSLVVAAVRYDPNAAHGMSGALLEIAQQPFGHLLLAVIAIGLAAFGVFAIVNGMYRKIDAT